MKSALLSFFLFVSVASANIIYTVSDPFGQGSPDVIGEVSKFDIQQATFNLGATSAVITLSFNFGDNNTNLDTFSVAGLLLNVGDLFLSNNGVTYGLALRDHNGVSAGTLYQINDLALGQLTASEALGSPANVNYRPNEVVWMDNSTPGALTAIGNVFVNQNLVGGGDGVVNPEFTMTFNLDYSLNALVASNFDSPTLSMHFAAATCGNDILDGTAPIPEPSTWAALSFGCLFALWRIRKNSSKARIA